MTRSRKNVFITRSAAETKALGVCLGRVLGAGDAVALSGGLGAGKTVLAKGIAKGLSVASEKEVHSPTFSLINRYRGRCPVFHMDWYRLEKISLCDRGLIEECFNPQSVVLVEWPSKGKGLLPPSPIRVEITVLGKTRRKIRIVSGRISL